jgi:hypothetical protein
MAGSGTQAMHAHQAVCSIIQLTSTRPPQLFARNLGSGEPLATGTTLRAADQAVYHDPGRPSGILLPVSGLAGRLAPRSVS